MGQQIKQDDRISEAANLLRLALALLDQCEQYQAACYASLALDILGIDHQGLATGSVEDPNIVKQSDVTTFSIQWGSLSDG